MGRSSSYHSQSSLRRRRVILQLQHERETAPATQTAENDELAADFAIEGRFNTAECSLAEDFPQRGPISSDGEGAPSANSEAAPTRVDAVLQDEGGNLASPERSIPPIGSVPSTVPGLLRLMRSSPRLHWLFAGDSLEPGEPSPTDGSRLMRAIREHVHQGISRRGDVFTSCETEAFQLRNLLESFDSHAAKHSPHIVVVTCGVHELQARGDSALAFERMFHRLILKIRNAGAVPIITTPPSFSLVDDLHHSDELVRLEAIRACAEESAALLVDYWEEWEHHSQDEMFLSPGDHQLSDQGREAAVREFARSLQLSRETAAFNAPRQRELTAVAGT